MKIWGHKLLPTKEGTHKHSKADTKGPMEAAWVLESED